VFKLSAFSPQNFFHLAPESFWVANYKAGDGDKTNYTRAANDLISASIKRGRFDSHSLRGLGVWLDDDRVVVNTGDKLYVDNREMPLAWDKGCYIYVHTHHKMRLSKNVATIDECRLLLDACSGLKFTDDKAMHLLAGWLAIARVAGALPVRPHIWLTGGSATGKSTVLTRLIEPALGGQHTFLSCVGGTTEAGIRQTLKSSSLPAVFDEFESVNKATKERHESIIELLRNTWSATNGQIIKGSAGGTSNSFNLAFPALLSSIGVNLLTDADRSRFSVLELMPHGDDPTQFARLCDALNKITPELGNRIFNRMVQMIPALLKNYALLRDAIARQSRQRLGQQIGMLMAGWCCLSYDETITEETARAIAIELEVEKINEDRETEEQACLRHLMTTIIRLDEGQSNESASIEQVIFAKSEDGEGHAKELRKYGILVKDGFIYVSNKHSFLQKVFNATQWPNWSVHLKRLKEASICNTAIYFSAGQVAKSVKIPLITLKHN
jgi:hypothetical protein